jgi:hypothetical protein
MHMLLLLLLLLLLLPCWRPHSYYQLLQPVVLPLHCLPLAVAAAHLQLSPYAAHPAAAAARSDCCQDGSAAGEALLLLLLLGLLLTGLLRWQVSAAAQYLVQRWLLLPRLCQQKQRC